MLETDQKNEIFEISKIFVLGNVGDWDFQNFAKNRLGNLGDQIRSQKWWRSKHLRILKFRISKSLSEMLEIKNSGISEFWKDSLSKMLEIKKNNFFWISKIFDFGKVGSLKKYEFRNFEKIRSRENWISIFFLISKRFALGKVGSLKNKNFEISKRFALGKVGSLKK